MVQQLQGPLAGSGAGGGSRLITAQQLHQRCSQLFGGTSGALTFQGVPVAVADAQLPVQGNGGRQGLVGPPQALILWLAWGVLAHEDGGRRSRHPDGSRPLSVMDRPRQRLRGASQTRVVVPGMLHHLGALLSLPVQARLASGVSGRRQRQRLALAQRLLDPLPPALRAGGGGEWFWRPLRWGSVGLLLAWWLQR